MMFLKRIAATLLTVVAGVLVPLTCHSGASPKVLVLYPQISPAYDQIFNEIIAGVKSHPNTDYAILPIQTSATPQEISGYINRNSVDAIIALGKQTYDLTDELKVQIPVVHGGLMITPDGHSGISLAGSPEQFFSHLNEIAPGVKRVFTVYNEESSGWLIRLAQQSAAAHDIQLKAYAANDIREAVKKFRIILDQAKDSSDGIWLLLDNILPDKTIMPMALEAAWQYRVVIFSNNPSHTRRGALFALFPDNTQMGRSLAELALKMINDRPRHPIVLPLSDLKLSINRRTASHLGVTYAKPAEEELDVIYPVR